MLKPLAQESGCFSRRNVLLRFLGAGIALKTGVGCRGEQTATSPNRTTPASAPPNDGEFFVRTPAQLDVAVGDLRGLTEAERRFFQAGDGFFKTRGKPKPGEWLDEQKESGQTYDQWRESEPNLATQTRDVIDIVPVGPWSSDAPTAATLKAFTTAFFGLPVRVRVPTPLKKVPVKSRQRTTGMQLLTPDVNDWLLTQLKPDTYCALAVTMTDLFPGPSWNFVFGQARLRQRVGVFSFARHDPGFGGGKRGADWRKTLLKRSLWTLAHETSHMFGIGHCVYYDCLLAGSNSQEESDRAANRLCPVCLRKLQVGAGFNMVARYEKLATFYDGQKLKSESAWIQRRLAWLKRG